MLSTTLLRVASGLFLLAVTAAPARAQEPEVVRIHGSNSMVDLNRELTSRYVELGSTVEFVVEGAGSETGIRALLAGEVDIAAASRRLTRDEAEELEEAFGATPREVVVGLDGVSFYVHRSNPVQRLTVSELAGILSGRITNWGDVGGLDRRIDVYNRDSESGTRAFVQSRVLHGRAFSEVARDVSSFALLVSAVASNPNAVGYSGVVYTPAARTLRIAKDRDALAVLPSETSVSSGEYPLSRPLYYYVHPAASSKQVSAYVDWVLSPEGQEIVSFVGYTPAHRPVEAEVVEASADAEEEPATVTVTPATMDGHGLRLAVAVGDGPRPDRRRVTVLFSSRGETLAQVEEITLRLGEDAEVLLHLAEDRSLEFVVRADAVATSSVQLHAAGGKLYVIRLADFVRGG